MSQKLVEYYQRSVVEEEENRFTWEIVRLARNVISIQPILSNGLIYYRHCIYSLTVQHNFQHTEHHCKLKQQVPYD